MKMTAQITQRYLATWPHCGRYCYSVVVKNKINNTAYTRSVRPGFYFKIYEMYLMFEN